MKVTVNGADVDLRIDDQQGEPVAQQVDYGTIRAAAHAEGWPVIGWEFEGRSGNLKPGETLVVHEGMAFTTNGNTGGG